MKLLRKKEIVAAPDTGNASQPASPYLAGRQEWLERYGSYIKRAAQWRTAALVASICLCLSLVATVILSSQSRVVPYIVEVDQLGRAMAVARADQASDVPDTVIRAALANVIVNWRTVTADVELQRKFAARLAAYTTGAARGMLKEWFDRNNPFVRAKDQLVGVEINGMPLPVSAHSWRIEWTETVRTRAGDTLSTTVYEATATARVVPPASDESILRNPCGVFFTTLSFARKETEGQR